MNWQMISRLAFLLLAVTAFGCAGMTAHSSDAPGTPEMMGCNGDRSSSFPPYCQPGH